MQTNFMIFIFPSCKNMWNKIEHKMKNYQIKICKKKIIYLTDIGKFNLIKNLYEDETWLGNFQNNYNGLYYKLNMCFNKKCNKCKIYYVKSNCKEIINFKNEIRKMCKIGNHSIHSTGTTYETEKLNRIYFNNNTIKFLNCIKTIEMKQFNILFKKLKQYLSNNDIINDSICIAGSSILSLYNKRECYDLDFLFDENQADKIKNKINIKIESYNNYYMKSNFYKKSKISINKIVNNSKYHFYFDNIKFMSLELLKQFKIARNEHKDLQDIELINEVLKNENYRYK